MWSSRTPAKTRKQSLHHSQKLPTAPPHEIVLVAKTPIAAMAIVPSCCAWFGRWRSDASDGACLTILSALKDDSTKTFAYLHLILRAGNREIMGKSSEENLPR